LTILRGREGRGDTPTGTGEGYRGVLGGRG